MVENQATHSTRLKAHASMHALRPRSPFLPKPDAKHLQTFSWLMRPVVFCLQDSASLQLNSNKSPGRVAFWNAGKRGWSQGSGRPM
jgi:hypothetical protein